MPGQLVGKSRDNDTMLSINDAADLVQAPVATVRYWRHLGASRDGFRIGRAVRYWRGDVLEWLRQRTIHGAATPA